MPMLMRTVTSLHDLSFLRPSWRAACITILLGLLLPLAPAAAQPFTDGLDIAFSDGVRDVHVADIDGDGDMDVLSASLNDDTIAFHQNGDGTSGDGNGSSWTKTRITTSANRARSVYAADIEGDGDMDVLSASRFDDTIAFYRSDERRGGDG